MHKYIFIFCLLQLASYDDRLQTISLEKYGKTVFNLPLDLKEDRVISDFRNFGKEENSGQATIIVELKNKQSKHYLGHAKWLKPRIAALDSLKREFRQDYKYSPWSC